MTAPVVLPSIASVFITTVNWLTSVSAKPYKQWAAVKTWEGPIKVPPHKPPFKYKTAI